MAAVTRTAARCSLVATSVLLIGAAKPSVPSSSFTVTVTQNSGNPTGSDFVSGSWLVTPSLSYTLVCGRNNCTVDVKANAAGTFPVGAITALQVSVNGAGYTSISTSTTNLITVNSSGTTTGTIQFRYQLGWAGSPVTPAGSYSESITFTLTQSG